MKGLAYFSPFALGEMIQQTPLVEALAQTRAVTVYGPAPFAPAFNRLPFCNFKSISPWLANDTGNGIYVPRATRGKVDLTSLPPCNEWVAAHAAPAVEIGGKEPPGRFNPSPIGPIPGPHCGHILKRFGFPPFPAAFTVSQFERVTPPEVCLLSGPHWDNTRRMSPEVIQMLGARLSHKINLVGQYKTTPPRVSGMTAAGDRLDAESTEAALKIVGRSSVVIGPDCGFAYAAIAMGRPTIIIQSRASFNLLVPPAHHRAAWPFQKMHASCDLACKNNPVESLGRACMGWDCFALDGAAADCMRLGAGDVARLAIMVEQILNR